MKLANSLLLTSYRLLPALDRPIHYQGQPFLLNSTRLANLVGYLMVSRVGWRQGSVQETTFYMIHPSLGTTAYLQMKANGTQNAESWSYPVIHRILRTSWTAVTTRIS